MSVTAPTISADFVSGRLRGVACTVNNSGNGLSGPGVYLQGGNSTTLTFSIKNVGTAEVNLGIRVTSINATVLNTVSDQASPTELQVRAIGTYVYTTYRSNTGTSGFEISVSPIPMTAQS